MRHQDILEGKRVLVVDDEPDILAILGGLLDTCFVDEAADFETARGLIEESPYDAAILDIMGVKGYDLLEITTEKGIPTIMLTANALNPENLAKSIQKGAHAYVPKDKISDIEIFLSDILEAQEEGRTGLGKWFARLEPFFEKTFGTSWKEKYDPESWEKLD